MSASDQNYVSATKPLGIFSVTARTLQEHLLPDSDLQRDPHSKLAKAAFLKQVFFNQLECSISGHAGLLPGVNFS